jgi:hypothetical protein
MNKPKPSNSTYITVAIPEELHGEVRAKAVRQHMTWPTVIAEAMQLWLTAKTGTTP